MSKRSKPLKVNADIIQQYEDHFVKGSLFKDENSFKIIIKALRRRDRKKETFIKDYWIPELKKSLENKFNPKIRKEWEKDKEIKKKIKKSLQNPNCEIKNLKDYFFKWYFKKMKKGCAYCEQDNLLYVIKKKKFPKKAKDEEKPRRFLELDKKDSGGNYRYKNCALACYPCNNAKSNVFTENEFKKIGKTIAKVIKNTN